MNVIYGPGDSGKTTVARFTQAVLYGLADPSLRFLAPRQGEAVGAVSLSGARGSETLSRINDGTQRGALTLESRASHEYEDYYSGRRFHHHAPDLRNHSYDSGEHIAARWVGGIDEAEFAAVYAVEFPRGYSLDRLIDVTLSRGAGDTGDAYHSTYRGERYYGPAATVEEEIHLDNLDANVQQLETRRHELTLELEDLERNAAALRHDAAASRTHLQDQIAAIEHDQRSRTTELHRVEAEIQRVEEEIANWWTGIRSENEAATRYARECIDFLNQQVDRLQSSRSTLQNRADHLEDQMTHAAVRDDHSYNDESYSAELERKAHEIDRELAARRGATHRWSNEWRRDDAYTHLTPVLESLQNELTALAQHVRGSGRQIQHEGLHCELHHVHARIDETTRQIERLTAQRHFISDRIEMVDDRYTGAQHRTSLERERLQELRSRAAQLNAGIHAASGELESLRSELSRLERDRWSGHRNRIEHCRNEIDRVAGQVRQAVIAREDFAASFNRLGAPSHRELHPVTIEASHNLQRLTAGELVRISIDRDSRTLRVEDTTGQYHDATVLSAGSRDLVKLSLCLALASDRARRQQQLPLLLDDAFRHLPSHCHRAAAELLCDYASSGWQVVLLTSQREVADLFKSYGAPVRNLPVRQTTRHTHRRHTHTHTGQRSAGHGSPAPVLYHSGAYTTTHTHSHNSHTTYRDATYRDYSQTPRDLYRPAAPRIPAYAWHGMLPHHPAPHRHTHTGRTSTSHRRGGYDDSFVSSSDDLWDYPEGYPHSYTNSYAASYTPVAGVRRYNRTLPIFSRKIRYTTSQPYHLHREEASLRVHRQHEPATTLRQETQHADGYFLRTSDEVTDIPFLEPAVANQLRDLDVYTVADLLHANAGELASLISRPGVKHSTVSRWQGMSRLMCEVRNLRSYDARILYACRIYDGQQLASIQPGKLQSILEDFVATPEGSRLVSSGTSAEIDRLTRWIKGGGSGWGGSTTRRTRNGRSSSSRSSSTRSSSSGSSSTRNEAYEGLHTADDQYDRQRDDRNGSRSSGARSSSSRSSTSRSSSSRSSTGSSNGSRSTRSQDGASDRASRERAERRRLRREREARERSQREPQTQRDQRPVSHENGAGLRFYLSREQEVTAAPSIGPKTADRLNAIGVYTVDDLLRGDAADIAARLGQRRIKASHILDWQRQAELVCCTPGLRGHDAQILVHCDVHTATQLAAQSAPQLFAKVKPFCKTKEGIRIIRNGKEPDLAEVHEWITAATHRRQLAAA